MSVGTGAARVAKGFARTALPDSVLLVVHYALGQGRLPNVIRPKAFSEKILCKVLFDRDPLLPVIADKLAVRDFVRERAGEDILNQIHAVYDRVEQIDLDELPDRFVLKANHGSGFNYFVASPADRNPEAIASRARLWLASNYGALMREWAYKTIPPRLFAEAYLEADDGNLLNYKFFCFAGEPRLIKVVADLTANQKALFVDLDWNVLPVMELERERPDGPIQRPVNFPEMLDTCRRLSRGFDFLRVDLYSIGGRTVFGELTNYHNAGRDRFRPRAFDYSLGTLWDRATMTYLPGRRQSSDDGRGATIPSIIRRRK